MKFRGFPYFTADFSSSKKEQCSGFVLRLSLKEVARWWALHGVFSLMVWSFLCLVGVCLAVAYCRSADVFIRAWRDGDDGLSVCWQDNAICTLFSELKSESVPSLACYFLGESYNEDFTI